MKTKIHLARWLTVMLLLLIAGTAAIAQPGPYPNSGDHTVCEGSTVSYGVNFTAGTSYTWTLTPLLLGDGILTVDPSNPNLISIEWTTPGTATLQLEEENGVGCSVTVSITVTINPSAIADAGIDQTICDGSTATMAGVLSGSATTGTWTTAGDGAFDNPNSMTAVYTPGPNDIIAGSVILTLTTNDPDGAGPAGPCVEGVDQMTLTISPAAIADAGIDQTICDGSTATMAGVLSGSATTGTWTTAGDGTFDNPNSMTAVYTPGPNDIIAGSVILTLTTNDPDGTGPCVEGVDQMTLTISPAAIADAGIDQTICDGSTATMAGILSGSATTGTWATAGDGTFDNPNSMTAVYTPGPNDIVAGSVILTLTTNDPDGTGPCVEGVDQMTLTISPAAIADAGIDQTICDGSTATMAGVLSGSATTGTWTTAGDGTFDNPNSMNAVYTPGPNDIIAGSVILTLTTNDPDGTGPCVEGVDQMTLTISPAAIADAGIDQTICSNETATMDGIISGSASIGTWTTAGDGTFDNPNSMTAVYTPGPNDIIAGSVILTLTTDDPDGTGPCVAGVDQMTLTLSPAPTTSTIYHD